MYIAVLEYLTESSSLSDVEKIRPAHLLELALKNRIGTPATDFTYTLANGQTGKLYNIKADYLLLFFTTVQRNYPIGSVDLNRNHSSDVLV